ncbi:MAG: NAD(P)-dependent oxidoreductase [Candidatus Dormibacterales bacterium]
MGTGRMGLPMAERLAAAGVDLTAWNRTKSKAEPLREKGARVVDRLQDLAGLDVVFVMVSGSQDLADVALGEDGLLKGRPPGILVDLSTVSTEVSALVRAGAADAGCEFLAGAVSGSPTVVRAGGLGIVASGSREVFESVRPYFEVIGRTAVYAGPGEVARLVKLCHNLHLAAVIQSLAEVTVLAEKGGVARSAFLQFLNGSSMGSRFTGHKAPALVHLDFRPLFTMRLLRKDLDLGLTEARQREVPMPLTALVHQIVQAAVGEGYGEKDFAALLEVAARGAGLALGPEDVEVGDGL